MIVTQKKTQEAIIHAVANSNTSLAQLANTGQTVTAAVIARIEWSGSWKVQRGANTVAFLTGNGRLPSSDMEAAFDMYPGTAINLTMVANGIIMLKVKKRTS